jgi:LmbE family N-acetylglucosaminyl deacetylase
MTATEGNVQPDADPRRVVPSHPAEEPPRRRPASAEGLSNELLTDEPVPPVGSCVIVVAHPDDDCFGCSGTAAKWAAGGATVHLVVATDGSKGSHDLTIPADAVAATREVEQRAAAELLGYRGVTFLGHRDGELVACEEAIRAVVELIRTLRPDVVIGHDPWRLYQMHPDHRAAGEIVRDAAWRAGEPRISGSPAHRPAELWLFGAQEPNHVEDISEWMEPKWQALMRHRSQYESAFRFSERDSAGRGEFERWFRQRFQATGDAAGVAYGESFRRVFL